MDWIGLSIFRIIRYCLSTFFVDFCRLISLWELWSRSQFMMFNIGTSGWTLLISILDVINWNYDLDWDRRLTFFIGFVDSSLYKLWSRSQFAMLNIGTSGWTLLASILDIINWCADPGFDIKNWFSKWLVSA